MRNIFKEVMFNRVKYSKFDLSHDRKFSTNMGVLTPIMCMEVLPGDRFNVQGEQMIRLAPMLSPMMHRVDVYTHYFFVPNRIVWEGWEDFISPDDPANVPEFPLIHSTIDTGSLGDHMGLPNSLRDTHSALPFAAYAKIYNEYYRDQNLIDPITDFCEDGDNNLDLSTMAEGNPLRRAWEHDYFTACLPFAQKGDPVQMPLSGTADVNYNFTANDTWVGPNGNPIPAQLGGPGQNPASMNTSGVFSMESSVTSNYIQVSNDNSANLEVDLSSATATTIADFRRAIRLQEWLEKNARGGTRYIETIFSHFDVQSDDARLQRPEYLGGGKSPVMISEVLQNSANDAEPTPIGTMAGHGLNVGESNSFSKRFKEHGYIIGIMSVMPKTAYYHGVPRHFSRRDTLDFAWPSFAHIGEQEVLNKEIHWGHAEPDGTFGYIPRYSEYRYQPSSVHGDFRDSLDFWHMARDIGSDVALNKEFIECLPTTRVFAAEGAADTLWCHVYNKVSAVRPLPKYGIPTI